MTCRTWRNRCNRSSDASPGEVGRGVKGARRAFISTLDAPPDLFRIEHGNEAKRSTVELRSLAVGFCCCIKGSPDFHEIKGEPVYIALSHEEARGPEVGFEEVCRSTAVSGISRE